MDTTAIRTRKGQGLWGGTITALCDEVDRLTEENTELKSELAELRNDAMDTTAIRTRKGQGLWEAVKAMAEAEAEAEDQS